MSGQCGPNGARDEPFLWFARTVNGKDSQHSDRPALAQRGLLKQDQAANPSHYAMMTISEGAHEIAGTVIQTGVADPYGHKKLGGIGAVTAERLEKMTGVKTMCQQLAYLMRSGAPDALDIMVAVNYANTAMDLLAIGKTGRMVALRDGRYTDVSAESPTLGKKHVDVRSLYDVDNYRPKVWHVLSKPMFLY